MVLCGQLVIREFLSIGWLASIGEQDTCKQVCLVLASDDSKFRPYQQQALR